MFLNSISYAFINRGPGKQNSCFRVTCGLNFIVAYTPQFVAALFEILYQLCTCCGNFVNLCICPSVSYCC